MDLAPSLTKVYFLARNSHRATFFFHRDAIFSLINLTESTIATGDDQGCIKVTMFHVFLCLFLKVMMI
jgi:hypothetical protein